MKKRIVILAGPSGGGKTFKEKELCIMYDDFNKLKQVTTRKMRHGESQGNPYQFITKEEYKKIEDKLIGKTIVKGEFYGTLFEPKDNSYNTIILNKLGIEDFIKEFENDKDIKYMIVMIDSNSPATREGRDIEYVNMERQEIMKLAHTIIDNSPPEFSEIEDLRKQIDEFFNC